MGLKPEECLVFEDAEKGVDAALAGGFYAVGVGGENLKHAHHVVPDFKGLTPDAILQALPAQAIQ